MDAIDQSGNLAGQDYLRERIEPKPGDPHYFILSDLLLALRSLIPANVHRVLDYGSGGSPYKSLFGNCVYHRADLSGHGLDFRYLSNSRLPPSVGGYDVVLSTQVLEHVDDPIAYLQECYRVLNPGGFLLVTTHGMFEDHGCPYDFWRWTTMGLQKLVESVGFTVDVNKKITTGPRAALFLAEHQFSRFRTSSEGFYGRLLALGIRIVQKIGRRRLHISSDASFRTFRVVDANVQGHDTYIGIAIRAVRNGDASQSA